MTASAGFKAQLKSGANVVAEIMKLDLPIAVAQYATTKLTGPAGSNAETFIPGLANSTLKADANLDMTDTNGQLAFFNSIATGALFTLSVLTGVTTTSAFGISAYVKSFNAKLDVGAVETLALEFQATGAVTYTP